MYGVTNASPIVSTGNLSSSSRTGRRLNPIVETEISRPLASNRRSTLPNGTPPQSSNHTSPEKINFQQSDKGAPNLFNGSHVAGTSTMPNATPIRRVVAGDSHVNVINRVQEPSATTNRIPARRVGLEDRGVVDVNRVAQL